MMTPSLSILRGHVPLYLGSLAGIQTTHLSNSNLSYSPHHPYYLGGTRHHLPLATPTYLIHPFHPAKKQKPTFP